MSTREALALLASKGASVTMPAGEMLKLLDESGEPEVVSTVQASKVLGFSPKWWSRKCIAGEVDGAWQEEGYWRFPIASARALIARRQLRNRRGPEKAQAAQAARARAEGVQDGQVLALRPETLVGRKTVRPKPERPRLA